MLRSVLAAVGGYIVMVIVVISGLGIAWMILGGSGAFAGEGPDPSTAWMAFSLAFGLIGAVAGGFVAGGVGRSMTAVKILIGVLLVLGVYLALTADSNLADRTPIDKPVAEMSFTEAGQHARQPAWYNWVIPLVGAAGVWIGGRKSLPAASPTS